MLQVANTAATQVGVGIWSTNNWRKRRDWESPSGGRNFLWKGAYSNSAWATPWTSLRTLPAPLGAAFSPLPSRASAARPRARPTARAPSHSRTRNRVRQCFIARVLGTWGRVTEQQAGHSPCTWPTWVRSPVSPGPPEHCWEWSQIQKTKKFEEFTLKLAQNRFAVKDRIHFFSILTDIWRCLCPGPWHSWSMYHVGSYLCKDSPPPAQGCPAAPVSAHRIIPL